jgi:hypothetical protein
LRGLVQHFVQSWSDTFGFGEGSGWHVIVSAVRSVLDTVGAVEVAGFNPFAGCQTVVAHLQLPETGTVAANQFLAAARSLWQPNQAADAAGERTALVDAAFESGCLEATDLADVFFQETLSGARRVDAPFEDCGPEWQEWLAVSLLACGLPAWVVRESLRQDDRTGAVPARHPVR